MQINRTGAAVTHTRTRRRGRALINIRGLSFVQRLVTSVAPGKPLNEEDFSQEPHSSHSSAVMSEPRGGAKDASGPSGALTDRARSGIYRFFFFFLQTLSSHHSITLFTDYIFVNHSHLNQSFESSSTGYTMDVCFETLCKKNKLFKHFGCSHIINVHVQLLAYSERLYFPLFHRNRSHVTPHS